MKAAKAAFDTSVDAGITFFDTAEVYGSRVGNGLVFQLLLKLISLTIHNLLRKIVMICCCRCHLVLSALKHFSEGNKYIAVVTEKNALFLFLFLMIEVFYVAKVHQRKETKGSRGGNCCCY